MRATPQEVERLRQLMTEHPLDESLAAYKARGLTQRRWVFDKLWAIPQARRWPLIAGMYDRGLNDDHIYTALKAALRKGPTDVR
jgi:hypothetical protein